MLEFSVGSKQFRKYRILFETLSSELPFLSFFTPLPSPPLPFLVIFPSGGSIPGNKALLLRKK